MPRCLVLLLLLLLMATTISVVVVVADGVDNVVSLTDDSFSAFVEANTNVMMEFYAPWCGHCQALQPEYDAAAVKAKDLGLPIVFAKMDITDPKCAATGEEFGIESFPTLKLFIEGEPEEYNGGRTTGGILNFIEKQLGGGMKEIDRITQFNEMIEKIGTTEENQRPVVIGIFREQDIEPVVSSIGSDKKKTFVQMLNDLANENEEGWQFAVTKPGTELEKYLTMAYNTAPAPVVMVFRIHRALPAVLKDMKELLVQDKVLSFLAASTELPSPVLTLRESDIEMSVEKRKNKNFLVEFYAPWCGYCKDLRSKYIEVANIFLRSPDDNVVVVKLDASAVSEEFSAKYKIEGFPTIKLFKRGIFTPSYEGPLETDAIVSWTRSKLLPSLVSVGSVEEIEALFGETDHDFEERKAKADDDPYGETVEDTRPLGVVVAAGRILNDTAALDTLERAAFQSPGLVRYAKLTEGGKDGVFMYRASTGRYRHGRTPVEYTGDRNNDVTILNWARRASLSNAIKYQDHLLDAFTDAGVRALMLVFIPLNYPHRDNVIDEMSQTGDASRMDMLFSYVDQQSPQLLKHLGVPTKFKEPVVKILKFLPNDRLAVFNADESIADGITSASLEALVEAFKSQRLPRFDASVDHVEEEDSESEPEEEEEPVDQGGNPVCEGDKCVAGQEEDFENGEREFGDDDREFDEDGGFENEHEFDEEERFEGDGEFVEERFEGDDEFDEEERFEDDEENREEFGDDEGFEDDGGFENDNEFEEEERFEDDGENRDEFESDDAFDENQEDFDEGEENQEEEFEHQEEDEPVEL